MPKYKPLIPCPKNINGIHRFRSPRSGSIQDTDECRYCGKTHKEVKEERRRKRQESTDKSPKGGVGDAKHE